MSVDPRDEAGGEFVADPRITRYPGTFIRDWIMLCDEVPDSSYRAYSIIRAHIWEKDEDRRVRLTQAQIADMLHKSEERVRKILKPLLKVGLVTVAEKRQWWEYNPATRRNERRTMNIYAVTDFPPEDYEGPTSMADFRRRAAASAAADPSQSTDRSKTTGRGAPDVSAGQTDRSETTGGSSSQATGVSAGQTDRSKMTAAVVKNDRPYKKPLQEGEGEERDSRARARTSPDSPHPEPAAAEPPAGAGLALGVRGGRRPPSQADADVIAAVAEHALEEHEDISKGEHYELATMVHAAVEDLLARGEDRVGIFDRVTDWLSYGLVDGDGRKLFDNLTSVLRYRLAAVRRWGQYCAWRAKVAAAEEDALPGPSGGRPAADDGGAFGGAAPSAGWCRVHVLALSEDGRCHECEAEAWGAAAPADGEHQDDAAAPEPFQDAADEAEPDPEVLARMRASLDGGQGAAPADRGVADGSGGGPAAAGDLLTDALERMHQASERYRQRAGGRRAGATR